MFWKFRGSNQRIRDSRSSSRRSWSIFKNRVVKVMFQPVSAHCIYFFYRLNSINLETVADSNKIVRCFFRKSKKKKWLTDLSHPPGGVSRCHSRHPRKTRFVLICRIWFGGCRDAPPDTPCLLVLNRNSSRSVNLSTRIEIELLETSFTSIDFDFVASVKKKKSNF